MCLPLSQTNGVSETLMLQQANCVTSQLTLYGPLCTQAYALCFTSAKSFRNSPRRQSYVLTQQALSRMAVHFAPLQFFVLSWHAKLNVSLNRGLYFTRLSERELMESNWIKENKKPCKVIGQTVTFRADHSDFFPTSGANWHSTEQRFLLAQVATHNACHHHKAAMLN